jgi:RHS repeat-associated protein
VTDRFFSSDWQLLETKVGFNTITRNVWSPVYVDGLVLRDRDTDANGTLDERLYALQDANWNTTALVNSNGTVQERYTYTPFGQVTFRDGSGSTLSSSAKDWVFLHQGGERIAAGDYEFRNRVYSPTLGRWLSNDPLGFEAGDQNWYRAIGNNPLNFIDPLGLDSTRAKLINAMAKGDVAEVKSTFEVLKAIAPNLLEDGLGATVEKWLAAQAAKEAAAIAAATIAKQALIKSLTPISKQVVKETGPKARRMLEEMAKKAGHELKSGGEHIKVIDKSGNTVTVIPHTPKGTGTIRSIAQAILDSVR